MYMRYALLLFIVLILGACQQTRPLLEDGLRLVDPHATKETQALYANLKRLAPESVLFGHEDDLAYGVTWKEEPGRSDVKETVGSYPAVYGWDIGKLELGVEKNIDSVRFDAMRGWIQEGYMRGGVITISWHAFNPVTGGDTWDTTPAVAAILPGGSHHEVYKTQLDRLAAFFKSLTAKRQWWKRKHAIPVIFRPFHEHTGSWFWWGHDLTTTEDYVALWRFTVEYLRDEKDVHNLIYAYSPDVTSSDEQYLERYPGDTYVDVLGVDNYHDMREDSRVPDMTARLRRVVLLAEAKNKIPVLSETGLEGIPDTDWWTQRLLASITADPVASRIAYVLVWRNANEEDKPGHFYGPHPDHPSAPDFIEFRNHPLILFEDDLPDLYR